MSDDIEITLLTREQVANDSDEKLEVFQKYGTACAVTDLAILTGALFSDDYFLRVPDDHSWKGRTGHFYTKSSDNDGDVLSVTNDGSIHTAHRYGRYISVRPVLKIPTLFDSLSLKAVSGLNGVKEVEFGEYPHIRRP